MNYIEITNKYNKTNKYNVIEQKYFLDDKGIKYSVDGKRVVLSPTKREIKVANLLGRAIGGNVNIIPKVNFPIGIKTPDYIINGKKFDLKGIRGIGKYVIEGNLRKKKLQANNFIIDITNSKIGIEEVKRQIESIYRSKRFLWIDKIFIIKGNDILKVYKRK